MELTTLKAKKVSQFDELDIILNPQHKDIFKDSYLFVANNTETNKNNFKLKGSSLQKYITSFVEADITALNDAVSANNDKIDDIKVNYLTAAQVRALIEANKCTCDEEALIKRLDEIEELIHHYHPNRIDIESQLQYMTIEDNPGFATGDTILSLTIKPSIGYDMPDELTVYGATIESWERTFYLSSGRLILKDIIGDENNKVIISGTATPHTWPLSYNYDSSLISLSKEDDTIKTNEKKTTKVTLSSSEYMIDKVTFVHATGSYNSSTNNISVTSNGTGDVIVNITMKDRHIYYYGIVNGDSIFNKDESGNIISLNDSAKSQLLSSINTAPFNHLDKFTFDNGTLYYLIIPRKYFVTNNDSEWDWDLHLRDDENKIYSYKGAIGSWGINELESIIEIEDFEGEQYYAIKIYDMSNEPASATLTLKYIDE